MMDESDELLKEIWDHWKPYNRAKNDKWRSYVVSQAEATLLDSDSDCITLANSENGIYLQLY